MDIPLNEPPAIAPKIAPPTKKRSGCATCAIGCAVLAALAAVVFFSTGYWLIKKGDFETETTLLNEEADFFVEMYVTADDQLLVDFLTHLANTMNQQNPVMNKFPFLASWNEKKTRRDFQKILPIKLEATGNVAEDDFRASAGFSLYNNLANVGFYFFKRAAAKDGRLREHEGVSYIELDDGHQEDADFVYISLINSVVYVCSLEEGMKASIRSEKLSMEEHVGFPGLYGANLDSPIYGYVRGQAITPNLIDFLELSDPELKQLMSGDFLQRIAASIRIRDQSSIEVEFAVFPQESSDPATVLRFLQAIAEELQQREHPKFTCQVVEEIDMFKLTLEISELDQAIQNATYVEY